MNIVMLGSGNVATHLGKALQRAGHNILEVWSKTFENARILASLLQAEAVANVSKISRQADIYIISVSDDVIADVAALISATDKLIIHTSGSTEIEILKPYSQRYGVLYPLQTFSKKQEVDFKEIPLVLEGSSKEVELVLKEMALRLSSNVHFLNSNQRRILHLAAVFACNFTNHLYALADNLLKENNLKFDLVRPLITETARKVQHNNPVSVQTGPAARNDKKTIDKHLELLRDHPELQDIYKLLSQSIVNLN
ncbi:MAG TPA: Rossmann-like and DUF2520 domain-containing protein [Sphingobacteriaceae bacterium]